MKHYLLLITLVLASMAANAQRLLVIEQTDETKQVIPMSEISKVEFKEKAQLVVSPMVISSTAQGGSFNLNVVSNSSWTAKSRAEWIKVNTTQGVGSGILSVTVLPNENGESRTGTIVVSADDVTVEVTFNQVAPEFYLVVDRADMVVGAEGGMLSFNVRTNMQWSLSSSAAWLTPVRGSGVGSGEAYVQAQSNTTDSPRSATLTVVAIGSMPKAVSVTVSQPAASSSSVISR